MKLGKYALMILFVSLLNCSYTSSVSGVIDNQDVIIYGGTAAAVMAAVEIARSGKKVIIVCPDKHLGGMTSSGLGWTDTGKKEVIGGLAREFYQRVYAHYQKNDSWKWQDKDSYGNVGQGNRAMDGKNRTMWIFEPHVAEQIFEDFIKENKIVVIRNEWLDRDKGVEKLDGIIRSITMESGLKLAAKLFIDATYEGDLMAASGIKYHVGREANSIYGEHWNGIQTGVLHHRHHFGDTKIDPYIVPGDSLSGVLPRISKVHPGNYGEGDDKVQAYCYRMCLTQVEENRLPFYEPENYDASQYELLVRILDNGWNETFDKFDAIPNLKTDVNNHGPFSFDNIGMNYEYPDASYERRAEIIKEHQTYQKGLLYFYTTDPRIPKVIQDEMRTWGFAKDEFVDNGHWPHQIYIREARRMIGEYVMTENEVSGRTDVPNPIGMGSYTMDSHNIQRYITVEGFVQNEGDIGVPPKRPYQIAMGSIVPKKEECKNLLVPVALSSSHIAYGSIRMEPVFMILGQSAAIMAEIAIEKGIELSDLDYKTLKQKLIEKGQILSNVID